jgi:hypothetical protein
MSRKIILLLLATMLVLSACSTIIAGGTSDEPRSSDDPDQGTDPLEEWAPQPGDQDLVRSGVEIEKTDILILESFPPQYVLHLEGWKGNPCQQLRVIVSEPDDQNRIEVEVYTVMDPDEICIQVLENLDINIPLGSFESGEYSVWVNAIEAGSISAP